MATIVTSIIVAYICTVLLIGMFGTLLSLFNRNGGLDFVTWAALSLLAFLTRFARRCSKLLNKHISDKGAHK